MYANVIDPRNLNLKTLKKIPHFFGFRNSTGLELFERPFKLKAECCTVVVCPVPSY